MHTNLYGSATAEQHRSDGSCGFISKTAQCGIVQTGSRT